MNAYLAVLASIQTGLLIFVIGVVFQSGKLVQRVGDIERRVKRLEDEQ